MATEGYKEIQIGGAPEEPKATVIEVNLEDEVGTMPPMEDVAPQEEAKPEVKAEPVKEKPEHVSRAQKRIKQLLADKQEAQAALERERTEKFELIKQLNEGNKAVRAYLKTSLENQVQTLTQQLKTAIQNGESEEVVNLQDKLIDAKMELKVMAVQGSPESPAHESPTRQPAIADRAQEWIAEYPQFKTDAYFRSSAIVENNQLISEGFDINSDEFYEELNQRLQGRFPKVFGVKEETSVSSKSKASSSEAEPDAPELDVKPAASQSKVRTTEQTVSGSSRPSASAAPARKTTSVTLTPEHIKQADRWNISLEQMARRVAHMEANKRVDGYVPINMGTSN